MVVEDQEEEDDHEDHISARASAYEFGVKIGLGLKWGLPCS